MRDDAAKMRETRRRVERKCAHGVGDRTHRDTPMLDLGVAKEADRGRVVLTSVRASGRLSQAERVPVTDGLSTRGTTARKEELIEGAGSGSAGAPG